MVGLGGKPSSASESRALLLIEGGMALTVLHSGKGNDFPRGAPYLPCIERLMTSLPRQLHLSLAWNPWAAWCLLGDKTFLAILLVIMVTTIISRVLTTCQARCQVLWGVLPRILIRILSPRWICPHFTEEAQVDARTVWS